jgi:putative endonuclease
MRWLADSLSKLPETPGVYVLLGSNGLRYTGAARNLRKRLRDHLAGRGKRTKHQRPLQLVHHETCSSYSEALVREAFLKSGQGRAWLRGINGLFRM